jgi:hypothetical protein
MADLRLQEANKATSSLSCCVSLLPLFGDRIGVCLYLLLEHSTPSLIHAFTPDCAAALWCSVVPA